MGRRPGDSWTTGWRERTHLRGRGQRQQRGDGDTPWRVSRSPKSGVTSSDSEDSWTPVIRKRDRRECSAPSIGVTAPGADTGTISGSPHPLVVANNRLEAEETVLGAEGGIQTVEAMQ
ncbi:hypothetical protein NDU88_007516 [Pleurodeles waltl]|uniref:Uncharacterized protein n=1 Tax=Pleurodeles waltl TaxID=8319 RepID=A0AAV7QL10_PLEWA|nr:hypothetical protein NDU88_007516 [Pleurodeles waltl]